MSVEGGGELGRKRREREGEAKDVQASRMPGFKLASGPSRRRSDTVPAVVGAQLSVVGTPTLMTRPPAGMLKGFWAPARATMALVRRARVKRILMVGIRKVVVG